MSTSERPVSITYYAYFPAQLQFQARACGMELSEPGAITQVDHSAINGPWTLYVYFRCVVDSPEFDQMTAYIQRRVKAWGGRFDRWEAPEAGDPEVDLPGEWEDVAMYPIETLVAKNGATYKVKFEPIY